MANKNQHNQYDGMILTTLTELPGRRPVHHFGLVSGASVRSRHVFNDIGAKIKNLFGGELAAYSRLLEDVRQEATDRMVDQARSAGANAVLGLRYGTSQIAHGAAEIFVYGTAVYLEE